MSDEQEHIADVDSAVDEPAVDVVAEPEAEAEPVKEWSSEDEAEARAFGWKSADEWQGEKPPGYIDDPRAYTDRLDNFKPFAKLKETMSKLEADAAESARKMAALNERALADQRRQYEERMAAITRDQRAAVEEADTEKYDILEKQRGEIASAYQPDTPAPKQDPYVASYENTENGAWLKNPVLRKTAFDLVNGNQAILATGSAQAQIEYAEGEIRKMFPAYFPQPEKPKPAAPVRVDAGGLAGRAKDNGFSALPADAKAAFSRFVAEGLYQNNDADKKAFADEYAAA